MSDRVRRLATTGAALVLAAGIVVGLLTADAREPDRVHELASQLRCPVCQSESVADSPSETARQMRARIAELVADGRSDAEVLQEFVDGYGQWILLAPPFTRSSALLWVLPGAVLIAGILVVARVTSHRRRPHVELTPERRAAVARALAELDDGEQGVR
ncbi:MAG: cytochrome c-type biogenesis protein CcmH [Actinobacteria bacterium]|nr:cytochrome c-type biogenesis protein CcmH [Actinomycetota bacterium]